MISQLIIGSMKPKRTKVHNGHRALVRWRATASVSQADVAAMLTPKVTQPAVHRWESGRPARPCLATAVQLERITGGAVPATSWGYPKADVDAVLGLAPAVEAA